MPLSVLYTINILCYNFPNKQSCLRTLKLLKGWNLIMKNKTTALLLSIFLGTFGADRFYLGYTGLGIVKLLTCGGCGKTWTLMPLGDLEAADGETEFTHIPDWYRWEREQVRQQILDGTYKLDIDVDIAVMVDFKAIYKVGEGHLTHDREGFTLTGCGGRLRYTQKPTACYGLYADYYWYEIADTICIGDNQRLYYCFPRGGDVVARTRLAVEELYKLYKSRALQLQPAGQERL